MLYTCVNLFFSCDYSFIYFQFASSGTLLRSPYPPHLRGGPLNKQTSLLRHHTVPSVSRLFLQRGAFSVNRTSREPTRILFHCFSTPLFGASPHPRPIRSSVPVWGGRALVWLRIASQSVFPNKVNNSEGGSRLVHVVRSDRRRWRVNTRITMERDFLFSASQILPFLPLYMFASTYWVPCAKQLCGGSSALDQFDLLPWASEKGSNAPLGFKQFSRKSYFRSFEWEKTNFTTFSHLKKIFENSVSASPPGKKTVPTPLHWCAERGNAPITLKLLKSMQVVCSCHAKSVSAEAVMDLVLNGDLEYVARKLITAWHHQKRRNTFAGGSAGP